MHLIRNKIHFLAFVPLVLGDFLYPTYPAPTDLSSNESLVKQAWGNLSSTLDAFLKQGKNTSATSSIAGAEQITFSSSLFSLRDEAAAGIQYHYTAPQIANSVNGTKEVDGDSIYRVASISKLITVFAGQLGLSDEDWNSPVTLSIPELRANVTSPEAPSWENITLWSLASQLSGIQALGAGYDLLNQLFMSSVTAKTTLDAEAAQNGFPPSYAALASDPEVIKCSTYACPPDDFAAVYGDPAPVFPIDATPAYSDIGFMLLGLAISRITRKPYGQVLQDEIFNPLSMKSSFVNAPTSSPDFNNSVIVSNYASWDFPTDALSTPSGGVLSSIDDLNKLGIGFLNHTLLSKAKTKRWMKPHTHTASLTYSVGAPWEIVRYVNPSTGKVTDLYGKLGDSGSYGGILVVIPDFDAGFTFLNAWYEPTGTERGPIALNIINFIAEAIVPALEAQAALEAQQNFVGTYTSSDTNINSSLTISFNASTVTTSKSGLSISDWISNGTDMIQSALLYNGTKPRLLFSIPKQGDSDCAGNVTFQASTNDQWLTYQAADVGPYTGFYTSNYDWLTYDGPRYATGGVNTFTFEVDETGVAKSVVNGATRLMMEKKQ